MSTRITVRGLTDTIRDLDDVKGRLNDMRPVMDVIGEDIKSFVDDRFETSTDPTGRPWQPLKPETLKRRRGGSGRPLIDTGTLRNSIAARPGPRSVRIGTNVPYAPVHQMGGKHIPPRRFLPFTPDGSEWETEGLAGDELARIVEALILYIIEGRIE